MAKFAFKIQLDAADENAAQEVKALLEKFEFHGNVKDVLTKLDKGDMLMSTATKSFIRKKKA